MNKKKTASIALFCLMCTAGILYAMNRKPAKRKVNTIFASTGVKYVFFSTDGKCITLLDYDIFNIRQKYEDGVMLTTIANEYNMSEVTVCRILNHIKNLKQ